MSARCEKYDLPVESCAHCTGAEERARAEEHPERQERGPWFEAKYEGACATCGDAIMPGDLIRADGQGGYVCGNPCS